jgi:GNAT superfamily N-acetyltransferase
MSGYTLAPVTTPELWTALHDIRRAVLFAPGRHADGRAYDDNHPDDRSAENQPFVLLLDGRPVGTARLDVPRKGIGIVRLVAVVEAEHGKGHGRMLGNLIDAEARRRGIMRLYVNAAPSALGYYEKLGWAREVWNPSELTGIAIDCVQMSKALG